jgi:TonB family protein
MAPCRGLVGPFLLSIVGLATACSPPSSAPPASPAATSPATTSTTTSPAATSPATTSTTTSPRDAAAPPQRGVTPAPVARIKALPIPKGDHTWFAPGKDYPAAARALGIEGTIRVRLVVDEHGKVRSSVLLTKLGHGLDELALKRAAEIEFEPAIDTDGKPVAAPILWTFHVVLPKDSQDPADAGTGSGSSAR